MYISASIIQANNINAKSSKSVSLIKLIKQIAHLDKTFPAPMTTQPTTHSLACWLCVSAAVMTFFNTTKPE